MYLLLAAPALAVLIPREAYAHGGLRESLISFAVAVHLPVSFALAALIALVRGKRARRMGLRPRTRVFLPSLAALLCIVPALMVAYLCFDWRLPGFGPDPSVIAFYVLVTALTALGAGLGAGLRGPRA